MSIYRNRRCLLSSLGRMRSVTMFIRWLRCIFRGWFLWPAASLVVLPDLGIVGNVSDICVGRSQGL